MQKFPVVVYSATPCGIAVAIAVAREGVEVLLIEPTQHVGGLSTSGIFPRRILMSRNVMRCSPTGCATKRRAMSRCN